jgi:hydroxypyruvate reductase
VNPSAAGDRLRADLRRIFDAGVRAVEPAEAVRRHVAVEGSVLRAGRGAWDLEDVGRVLLLGAGKASAAMAAAVEGLLADRVADGWINTRYGNGQELRRVRVHEAGHPVPDENGLRGAEHILRLATAAGPRDLVVCCLSGGGSALMPLPAEGLALEDKQTVTRLLLASGASIDEMNAVRKHLSRIKGGRLAEAAWPASILTLALSDVVGDRLDVIASGPTVADPTTYADCLAILDRYGLRTGTPRAVVERLERGAAGLAAETPKADHPALAAAVHVLIGSNRQAVEAAAAEARSLGYEPMILSTRIEGETRDIARMHAAMAWEAAEAGRPARPPCCLLSGGETTVTVRGDGLGGRNQEFALAAALDLDGLADVALLCAGTDGADGPTDAAGAFADGSTIRRAAALGLDARDALRRNDSHSFFRRLGDLLVTGPTRTNVMDLRMILVGRPQGS